MAKLTHLDEAGAATMVAVDYKEVTRRRAVARGSLRVSAETMRLVLGGETPKGDIFSTARIAGIMAAKETSRLIPLCHPIKITGIHVEFEINEIEQLIEVQARVDALDQTGVEMEALTAVSVATLTLYDMLKAVDQHMIIDQVRLVQKVGGRRDFEYDPTGAEISSHQGVERATAREVITERETQEVAEGVERQGVERQGVERQGRQEMMGLWPVKVIGKHPTPTQEPPPSVSPTSDERDALGIPEHPTGEHLVITDFDELSHDSADDGLITSYTPSLVRLLTPTEPIPAINQPTSSSPAELPHHDFEGESDYDEDDSVLANPDEFLEPPISRPDLTEELSLRVKQVSLDYPPLRRFIVERPVECAYLLGYLSPEFASRSRAFILEDELTDPMSSDGEPMTQVRALLFIYSGLTLPTVWTYGGDLDVESILRAAASELPRRIYLNIEDQHVGVMRGFYALRGRRALLRMGLHHDQYHPIGDTEGVVQLGHRDTAGIMGLFQRYYPDHLFEPAQLDSGLYSGLRSEDSQLIAVAGIHLLNPEYRVAAIGNIVTDQSYRGQGHATRCVQYILGQLFEAVDHVALNVVEDNAPAIHCYRKFGFQTTTRLIEARASMLS